MPTKTAAAPHAARTQPQTTQGPELSRSVALIWIETSSFGVRRKLRDAQYEVDGADKDYTSASRKLLKSVELDEVKSLMKKARTYAVNQSLPFPMNAVHMVPKNKVEDIAFELDKYEAKIREAVDTFVEHYDERVAEAKAKNPGVFNPLDYPPKAHVAREFDFSYRFITIGTPEQQMEDVDVTILAKARKRSEQLWADAAEMTRQMQTEIMLDLVTKLREKLVDDPTTGKPKTLTKTSTDALRDFMQQFENSMNVTNFSELGELVKQGRKLLNGTTGDDLKDSSKLRATVGRELAAIEKSLQPMVNERKVRSGSEF